MNTSVAWMNDYLQPQATAQEQAELLTRAGLPMESREEIRLADGSNDTRQDIELTSNRGDCLCHVGLAREIAAMSGRSLKIPAPKIRAAGPAASSIISVTNKEPNLCPLYTARVIRNVKVGPSPAWLANRLQARGDNPRNNIVDASNFVLFELGQPTHVFDLARLREHKIIIRKAKSQESFLPIGEGAKEVKLTADDLVIADAERPVAIAGVKGGALTAVSNSTTDILIEAATFNPVSVRATSRRLGIASDSSYRFERGVHAGQINHAAERLVGLILQLCGGELCEGVVQDGQPIPSRRNVSMRCERCSRIIGVNITDGQMVDALARLGFEPKLQKGVIHCTIPHQRLDIEREIDLIEEVARLHGLDTIPVSDKISIRVAPPQSSEMAKRAVHDALVGMGYVETVTHSLISECAAGAFLPPNMQLMRVDDTRAKAEPTLRPSTIPSLLRVLALNRDHGVKDVKLFESASNFAMMDGQHLETTNLAMVLPSDNAQDGMRLLRGAIDRVVQIVLGAQASVTAEPMDLLPWFTSGAAAAVRIGDRALGTFGLLDMKSVRPFGLDEPVYAAEIGLPAWYDRYPPETAAMALPAYPGIERDVSAIVDDRLPWAELKAAVHTLKLNQLEVIDFVTTYRGKQIGAGKKSLTLRARFRAPDRTLSHDEIDPQMEMLMAELQRKFGAEIRK